jgi:hypothetical protein
VERSPLLAETEQVGAIFHVIACSEKKVGNRHRTKFRSSACSGKSFSAQLFSEFPERKIERYTTLPDKTASATIRKLEGIGKAVKQTPDE